MRAAYFGPEGTFTHEALVRAVGAGGQAVELELVPIATIHDVVIAVRDGVVDRAMVPIENSTEGAVNATLDTLAVEASTVSILAELVLPISQCLIARTELAVEAIEVVASHPQATGQCRTFLRTRLPTATIQAASSTAEAVRIVAEHDGPWAALGNRLAADLYGCTVLEADVQDSGENETRFVWLGPAGAPPGLPRDAAPAADGADGALTGRRFKTAIVFWGAGSDAPGWLVRCLSEFAVRDVNLTRIESRPLKLGLGSYMFFADLDGGFSDQAVAAALDSLRKHVEVLRVLGSFPAA
ncbi:MAG: prephenate dehydratase [Solirubrobacteraceae bacterium]